MQSEVKNPPLREAEQRPSSVHDICVRIKINSVEIASTVVVLAILGKIVWWELGLPSIQWDHIMSFK